MKSLNVEKMESIEGGATPSGTQVACYLISVGYGLINPVLGIISGAACLFAD